MRRDELSQGDLLRVHFSRPGGGGQYPLGQHQGHTVIPWDGDPRPRLGETWQTELICQWSAGTCQGHHWNSGLMVRPLRRLA